MSFKLEISTANAAFEELPGEELARILEELAGKLRHSMYSMNTDAPLRDVNGNRVGFWRLQNDD